jgi:Domain of unknown function (DUF4352)
VVVLCIGVAAVIVATRPLTSSPRRRSGPPPATSSSEQVATPAATTAAPATPTVPPTVKLGQTITVTSILNAQTAYTVYSAKQHASAPNAGIFKPERGVYLAISVEVRAVKSGAYATVVAFALVAADGTVYEPGAGLGFDGTLRSTSLNEGQKTSGLVVFDLPKAAVPGAKVELRAGLSSRADGWWQL